MTTVDETTAPPSPQVAEEDDTKTVADKIQDIAEKLDFVEKEIKRLETVSKKTSTVLRPDIFEEERKKKVEAEKVRLERDNKEYEHKMARLEVYDKFTDKVKDKMLEQISGEGLDKLVTGKDKNQLNFLASIFGLPPLEDENNQKKNKSIDMFADQFKLPL